MSRSEYVEPGWVDDGYYWTDYGFIGYYGTDRFSLLRPSSRSGTVKMLQPSEQTAGRANVIAAPYCAKHTMECVYNYVTDDDLAVFLAWAETVDMRAREWDYVDGSTGDRVPVRFEDESVSYEETGPNINSVTFSIWSAQTFFPCASVPGIGDADTVLARLYRPFTYERDRKQPLLRFDDGTAAVYNKSAIKRDSRSLSLPYRTRAELAALIAFYEQSAEGAHNTFSWTLDGVSKTVRFSSGGISWSQEARADELYDADLTVEEDV